MIGILYKGFSSTKINVILKLLFITENISLIDTQRYIIILMHRYLIYSIDTHNETL